MKTANSADLQSSLTNCGLARYSRLPGLRILLALACSGASACTQTAPGSVLSFNGDGQYVRIADFFTNAPTTEVTVEFWQNASGLAAQSSFSQDDSTREEGWDASNVFNAHVPYGDGRVYWDFGDISGEGRLCYTPPVSIVGTWQHFGFVASQTGNFMRIYRNGILEAEKAGMTPFAGGRFDLDIGGEYNHMFRVSFGGMLDEFRVWDTARSQEEIQGFMYRSVPVPQEGLVAYWRFDEGSGEVAHEASGNGRDGVLVNGPTWAYPDPNDLWIEGNYTNVAVGCAVSFLARGTGPMVHTVWDFGDGSVLTNQSSSTHAWSAPGTYTVRLTGYHESYPSGVSATLTVYVVEQQVHYVAADSTNPVPPYTSWATAAQEIQPAVDVAIAGDEIVVTNGVYATGGRAVGTNAIVNRVAVDRPLTLRSVNGPALTIIRGTKAPGGGNGDGAVRCLYLTDGARLSGFTLTNGATRAEGDYQQEQCGGGVFCLSAKGVITNCVMIGNSADGQGGGVYGCTLQFCTLMGNLAGEGGGVESGTLRNCLLTNNSAYWGGGASGSTLFDCTLVGNSQAAAVGWVNDCSLGGGAAWCTLYNCVLSRNTVEGGVAGGAAWSTLYDCTLCQNSANDAGGGFECTLYNCTLTGNSAENVGGAVYYSTLHNCTLIGNSAEEGGGAFGGALYNCTLTSNSASRGGGAFGGTLYNCIVYYNTAPQGANYLTGTNQWGGEVTTLLNYACTTPLPANGVGNTTGPPLFMNIVNEDFRLREGSPCIDAGTNLLGFSATITNDWGEASVIAYNYDPTDILGKTRFIDGNGDGIVAWDMGAYEFNPYRFEPTLRMTGDGFRFTVRGEPGRNVRIERSRDLLNWEYAGEVPIPASGQTLVDPAATSEPRLFYRAVRVP